MEKEIAPKLKFIKDYLKIKEDKRFVIPEYQRGYSWDIFQCDRLWQDIETFINNESKDPYFFGTIILDCSNSDKFGEYSLIDGQQRTTTFLLLLKAMQLRLGDILKNNKSRDEDSEKLRNSIKRYHDDIVQIMFKADEDKKFDILKDWSITDKIVLLENRSINEPYKDELMLILKAQNFEEAENVCHKIPKKQKNNKYTNFFRNFKYFYEEKLDNYGDMKLNNFVKKFLYECQVIEINSWQVEQAIMMFNSLNSTGMPLSDADIISAQLYSNSGNDKNKFNELWKDIISFALKLELYKIVNIDDILRQFMYINRAKNQEYTKNGYVDVTTPGLRAYYTTIRSELLNKPLELCNNFYKIIQIWEKVKDYPAVKLLLKFNENSKLFFISYLYRYNLDNISEDSIIDIVECLLRLFALLELVDAGYSSTNFKTFLFGENIKLVDANCSCEEIVTDFNEHINAKWDEDDIKQILLEYNRNTLVFLNEYLYSKERDKKFDFFESTNIEHIMPASGRNINTIRENAHIENIDEFYDVVNRLGNKILLEEDINKSIGNDWFQTKKQKSIKNKSGYKDSNYAIANDLINYPKNSWVKEDILRATEKAADRIIKFIFHK